MTESSDSPAAQLLTSASRLVLPVPAPAGQEKAIQLSRRSPNPVPESWLQVATEPRVGSARSQVAELWVRNVAQPTLESFLPDRSQASGAAMIVAPGGAFVGLAMDREGYSVAQWLQERAIAAFVLKYRLAPSAADWRQAQQANMQLMRQLNEGLLRARTNPCLVSDLFSPDQRAAMTAAREDALEAIRYVRSHAREFGVAADRIGMLGFSAGAMVTMDVALKSDADSRPDLIAPIYGGLPDRVTVPADAPPAFIAVAADDPLLIYCLAAYEAWCANGAAAELHVFEDGGHGFGLLRQGKRSDDWATTFERWLGARGFSSRATHLRETNSG